MPDGNFDLHHNVYLRRVLHYYDGHLFDNSYFSPSEYEHCAVNHSVYFAVRLNEHRDDNGNSDIYGCGSDHHHCEKHANDLLHYSDNSDNRNVQYHHNRSDHDYADSDHDRPDHPDLIDHYNDYSFHDIDIDAGDHNLHDCNDNDSYNHNADCDDYSDGNQHNSHDFDPNGINNGDEHN